MKKIIFALVLACFIWVINAQESNYVRVSADAGFVVNTNRDKKFGAGGSIGWLTVDNWLSRSGTNYIALHFKGFNNPYGEGKLISSILNDRSDAFNYIMPLVGYRFTGIGASNGFFAEPRVGVTIGAGGYTALTFSPLAGYAYENLEFSAFCDMGFGGKESAIRQKNFFTPGVSIAYNITLY